jgi:hypothetical protein
MAAPAPLGCGLHRLLGWRPTWIAVRVTEPPQASTRLERWGPYSRPVRTRAPRFWCGSRTNKWYDGRHDSSGLPAAVVTGLSPQDNSAEATAAGRTVMRREPGSGYTPLPLPRCSTLVGTGLPVDVSRLRSRYPSRKQVRGEVFVSLRLAISLPAVAPTDPYVTLTWPDAQRDVSVTTRGTADRAAEFAESTLTGRPAGEPIDAGTPPHPAMDVAATASTQLASFTPS